MDLEMIPTTLRKIRQHNPCREGWRTLLSALGKTEVDDEPLPLTTILQSNGLDDALWCLRTITGHDKEIIRFALACVQEVRHLMTDQRSLNALDALARHLESPLSKQELDRVLAEAAEAAWAAAEAAWAAAEAAGQQHGQHGQQHGQQGSSSSRGSMGSSSRGSSMGSIPFTSSPNLRKDIRMITTTLRQIRQHDPCREGWRTLLSALGKTEVDDEPLPLTTILQSNGLDDALWCLRTITGYDREIIRFALACAHEVSHLMTDQRSLDALDALERHLESPLSRQELDRVLAAAEAVAAAAAEADSSSTDSSMDSSMGSSRSSMGSSRGSSTGSRGSRGGRSSMGSSMGGTGSSRSSRGSSRGGRGSRRGSSTSRSPRTSSPNL